ncbi:MAG TPA: C1 family peptidase [Bacteroidales bacterium]|nr:C1 family peptidase [Bacteroidales bacterium]
MNKIFRLAILMLFISTLAYSQSTGYSFTMKKDLACTPVKNQNATSTCWCFSGISMLESELIRMGKKPYDLSEMFIVRYNYSKKADKYVRMHGSSTFAAGGEYGDLLTGIAEAGIVPDEVYPGLNYGEVKHNHQEMDGVLKASVDALIKGQKLTTAWMRGINGILDAYLGTMPSTFTYEG